jgi:hypothetical protein
LRHSHALISLARTWIALLAAAGCTLASAQVFIGPTAPGWTFVTELPTGSGAFVNGPGTPPSGSSGSVQLTVGNPGGEYFYTQTYAGTRLDQLAGLKYSTYVVSSALPVTAVMSFDFDNDLTTPTPSYGGRAVFDPGLLGAVTVGTWQSWDPMTQRAWYGSGTPGTRPLNSVCTQAAPCTMADMIAAFPNGGVLSDLFPGFFGFKLGNGGGPSQVSIDSFSIGTAGAGGPVGSFVFGLSPPVTGVPALSWPGLLLLTLLVGWVGLTRSRR